MKRIIFIFIFIVSLLSFGLASSDEVEPSFDKLINWKHHPSLGIILIYKTDYGKILFAHPVVDFTTAPECRKIALQHNLIAVLTNSKTPYRYTALKSASAFRYQNTTEWKFLLSKTSQEIK